MRSVPHPPRASAADGRTTSAESKWNDRLTPEPWVSLGTGIAEGRGRIPNLGKFPNRPEAVRKLIEKLGGGKNLKVCYEAGPTGYALYWQLTHLTPVWVPTQEHEALRDLVRQRAAAKSDESRAKHRLITLLLRHAAREPSIAWSSQLRRTCGLSSQRCRPCVGWRS